MRFRGQLFGNECADGTPSTKMRCRATATIWIAAIRSDRTEGPMSVGESINGARPPPRASKRGR